MCLDINIVSARGLTGVDPASKPKLYVVVSFFGAAVNQQRARTNVDKDGGGNPTWNFAVKFAVDVEAVKQGIEGSLVFALKYEDGRGDRDLGEVHVSVAELLQSAGDEKSMRYVAVSYPVRKPSGETVGVLNFEYKFGGSPASDTPAAGFPTRSIGIYPPQYCYPPPPPAAGYGSYPPPPQPSCPYPPPPQYHYTPPPTYQSYNVGPSATLPYPPNNAGPSAAPPSPYPPYNIGPSAAPPSPYPPYNIGPSAAPPYANPYAPQPTHVQARAPPVEQRSKPKKKKSVWGSALGVAGAVAVGVLSGVVGSSLELPAGPDVTDLTAGFQPPDPTALAPTDLSFINTFDPEAFRDATYVDYSSLI
ncbi:protein SRC2-like [Cucurbita pepo subsp. pepo]|uniref:protein SRC2-like n=1 Tax=Cucurbita pepo subsp. pepo TaxID=3664 RepID=UPI000C9DA4A9|nr:protein SRC2-like [Cucurbita pepo subsp. pepo]